MFYILVNTSSTFIDTSTFLNLISICISAVYTDTNILRSKRPFGRQNPQYFENKLRLGANVTRQVKYVKHNIETRLRNHCYRGKAVIVT